MGRPPRIPGHPARHRVETKLTDEERATLQLLALQLRLSVADTIRLAIGELADAGADFDVSTGINSEGAR